MKAETISRVRNGGCLQYCGVHEGEKVFAATEYIYRGSTSHMLTINPPAPAQCQMISEGSRNTIMTTKHQAKDRCITENIYMTSWTQMRDRGLLLNTVYLIGASASSTVHR